MNTLLPPTFIFNKANSLYPKTIKPPISYNNIHDFEKMLFYTIIALAIIGIAYQLKDYYIEKHPDSLNHNDEDIITGLFDSYNDSNLVTGFLRFIQAIATVAIIIILVFWPFSSKFRYNNQAIAYKNYGFKITNTNLIAMYENNDNTVDINPKLEPNKGIKQNHYKVYVNPDKQKPVAYNYLDTYLGKMTNGKFKPNNNQLGRTFAAYQEYIKSHHLEKHFKKQMLFIDSDKYATTDQSTAYVLVGDDDYTLL